MFCIFFFFVLYLNTEPAAIIFIFHSDSYINLQNEGRSSVYYEITISKNLYWISLKRRFVHQSRRTDEHHQENNQMLAFPS